jgi:hypothetical protein
MPHTREKHYNFHYTHVGITIDNPQQINVLAENQAKFRLGQNVSTPIRIVDQIPTHSKPTRADSSSNQSIVNGIGRRGTPRPIIPTRQSQAPARGTTNQDILRAIQPLPSTPPPPPAPRAPVSAPMPPPSLLRRMLRLIGLGR